MCVCVCVCVCGLLVDEPDPPSACNPNPCENGGSCIHEGSRYKCVCDGGFVGRNCENGKF